MLPSGDRTRPGARRGRDALRALRGRRGLLVAGGKRSSTYRTWEGFAAPGYAVRGRQGGHDAQAQHDQQEPGKTQTLGEAMIASTTSQALSAGE
jgi:hypothetical protein